MKIGFHSFYSFSQQKSAFCLYSEYISSLFHLPSLEMMDDSVLVLSVSPPFRVNLFQFLLPYLILHSFQILIILVLLLPLPSLARERCNECGKDLSLSSPGGLGSVVNGKGFRVNQIPAQIQFLLMG